jgi:NTP pyrophosphatase (non-canonical NTP hydrolase)
MNHLEILKQVCTAANVGKWDDRKHIHAAMTWLEAELAELAELREKKKLSEKKP